MTRTEDRLRAALLSAIDSVEQESLRPLVPGRGRPRRWPRVIAPAAAAAAVLLVVGVDVGIGGLTAAPRPAAGPAPAARVINVGGFPTGIAADPATGTLYIGDGPAGLAVFSTATCDAALAARCTAVAHANTAGADAIGVAIDERTHTAYVVNGGSGTVAVIDTATCDATVTSGCGKRPALIRVPGGPQFLAVDPQTGTVYVADVRSGQVSVINGNACNAENTRGCAQQPAAGVNVGAGAFPIAVDPLTHTVYAGTGHSLVLIDGRTCNGTNVSGCGKALATVPVGAVPAGITVDQASASVYVTSEVAGTVTVLNRDTCSSRDVAGCGARTRTIAVGADPRGETVDPAAHTLYVANAGSQSISVIDTRACAAESRGTCPRQAASFPVGSSPRRAVFDPATHALYAVNTGGATVSVVNTRICNATDLSGCPAHHPAGRVAGGAAYESSCHPAVTAARSGQPAGPMTAGSARVASGSADGEAWGLWARQGAGRTGAIEDGGLVIGGRWYGLCAGYPNVAELELVNIGGQGLVYGFVQHPGRISVRLRSGRPLPSPVTYQVNGMTFFIGRLPAPACAYPWLVLRASAGASFSAVHRLVFGACAPGKVVAIAESNGVWGPGIAGAPTAGAGRGGSNLLHLASRCDPAPTSADSGEPAGPRTAAETRITSGTAGGLAWSLWAANRLAGVRSVENGGVVIGGRWYGLCLGAPNPADFELLDAGPRGVVYGYVANPGRYRITLRPGRAGFTPVIQRVRGGVFFIGRLAGSACAYPQLVLQATTRSVTDLHTLSFGACRAGQLVAVTGGQGSW